jgi:hypothetical protein
LFWDATSVAFFPFALCTRAAKLLGGAPDDLSMDSIRANAKTLMEEIITNRACEARGIQLHKRIPTNRNAQKYIPVLSQTQYILRPIVTVFKFKQSLLC